MSAGLSVLVFAGNAKSFGMRRFGVGLATGVWGIVCVEIGFDFCATTLVGEEVVCWDAGTAAAKIKLAAASAATKI